MSDIKKLLNLDSANIILAKGWLVSLDNGFYLLDWEGQSNYWEQPKIFIKKDGLYNILKHDGRILFNGGGPAIFHRAEMEGAISIDNITKERCINPTKLLLENNNQWLTINLDSHYDKEKYDEISWNDLFN